MPIVDLLMYHLISLELAMTVNQFFFGTHCYEIVIVPLIIVVLTNLGSSPMILAIFSDQTICMYNLEFLLFSPASAFFFNGQNCAAVALV